MAFQLKSVLGHMMRPKQQAVAIASNNTDQMLFAAIAPASPTMQAQQQRMVAANTEAKLQHQQRQQSPVAHSVKAQQPSPPSGLIVPTAPPQSSDRSVSHHDATNMYGFPQLMSSVATPRLLPGHVYTTALQASAQSQANQPQVSLNGQSQQAHLSQFYLPPGGAKDQRQSAKSFACPTQPMASFANGQMVGVGPVPHRCGEQFVPSQKQHFYPSQQAPYAQKAFRNFQKGSDATNPFAQVPGQGHFNHIESQPFKAPFAGSKRSNKNLPQKSKLLSGSATNIRSSATNKSHKIEQQYFKSEAEAQAWEDQCLGAHLEVPGPKQFLQNVATKQQKAPGEKAKQAKKSGKGGKAANGQATTASQAKSSANATSGSGEQSFKMKFKTEICKFWQLNGTCEYAETCSFAHGAHELKQRTDQPRNYKTKQCKRFHKELYCPYGPRCQFLHDKPSTATPAGKKTKQQIEAVVKVDPAATISYTKLLSKVVESNRAEEPCPLDGLAADFSFLEKIDVPEEKSNELSRRLQVFADIPESLSDSQISIEQ